jgi:hypothetical protein
METFGRILWRGQETSPQQTPTSGTVTQTPIDATFLRRDDIMQRVYLIVTVTLLTAVLLGPSHVDWPSAAASPVPMVFGERACPKCELVGVSGCAAMACHNANGPQGTRGSEYTTWATVDPHARAYQILFDERSQHIQELRDTTIPAHEDVTCLKCHSTYRGIEPKLDHTLADGVGCESCHGPAQHWKATHFRHDFIRQTPGFNDLRCDLVVRAEVCMGCHVGDDDKDVNHDLIAAGHPRLRFEFSAYMANYPKHWSEEVDRKRLGSDLQAKMWLIGQQVSMRAAVNLLSARYTDKKRPWPEFAEYDCYACHHDLVDKSWRQRPPKEGRKLGQPPMNSWYSVMPQLLAQGKNREGFSAALEVVSKRMSNLVPRGQDKFFLELKALKESIRAPEMPVEVMKLLGVLSEDPDNLIVDQVDNSIQYYLALAALHQTLADMGQPDLQLRKLIEELRDLLRKGFEKTPHEAEDVHYDSPRNLKRNEVEKVVRKIQQHLGTQHP